jgi:Erg28 like protein
VTAITNAISCYNTDAYVRRLYSGPRPPSPSQSSKSTTTETHFVERPEAAREARRPSVMSIAVAGHNSPVTPLSSRTFATWNVAVGIVRVFAAYHIHEESWYQMQMITNIIGLAHFGMEAAVFKTAYPSGPFLAPTVVASIGLAWSIAQYSFYVR